MSLIALLLFGMNPSSTGAQDPEPKKPGKGSQIGLIEKEKKPDPEPRAPGKGVKESKGESKDTEKAEKKGKK
jgi:hypothetical protein